MADWGGGGDGSHVPSLGNMGAPPIPKVRRNTGEDDPFSNFSYQPKSSGRLRSFSRKGRYSAMASLSASREKLGSITSLASACGSQSNLSMFGSSQSINMNPSNMMNMQEDAKSRRISTEVMKHRLYESVVTSPRRRRMSGMSVHGDFMTQSAADERYISGFYDSARFIQSMPVTPAHSKNVTPAHSPTSHRKFLFGYFSRGTTPTTPDVESKTLSEERAEGDDGENWRGIGSLFKPRPRFVSAHDVRVDESEAMDCSDSNNVDNLIGFRGEPPSFKRPPPPDPSASGGFVLGEIRRPKPRRTGSPSQQNNHPSTSQDLNSIAPQGF